MEEKEKKERKQYYKRTSDRKEYGKHGDGSTQKMMSFRLDNDLVDWLKTVGNKGRLINHVLRIWMNSDIKHEQADRHDPIQPRGDFEEV